MIKDFVPFATVTVPILQVDAQQMAHTYLRQRLGEEFHPNSGVWTRRVWRFLIQYQPTKGARPLVVGRLDVDAQTGQVEPLTVEAIAKVQERLSLLCADQRGVVPLAESGYITPALAKRNVKGYVGQYVSLFVNPADQLHWQAGDPPAWCVPVVWSPPMESLPCTVGVIQVNAQTGAVIPLTEPQLQAMQRRIQDASPRPAYPTATAS